MCTAAAAATCGPAKVALSPVATYKALATTSALGVGDVNGDGKDDIVMAYGGSGAGLNVALNKGDGTFKGPPRRR